MFLLLLVFAYAHPAALALLWAQAPDVGPWAGLGVVGGAFGWLIVRAEAISRENRAQNEALAAMLREELRGVRKSNERIGRSQAEQFAFLAMVLEGQQKPLGAAHAKAVGDGLKAELRQEEERRNGEAH